MESTNTTNLNNTFHYLNTFYEYIRDIINPQKMSIVKQNDIEIPFTNFNYTNTRSCNNDMCKNKYDLRNILVCDCACIAYHTTCINKITSMGKIIRCNECNSNIKNREFYDIGVYSPIHFNGQKEELRYKTLCFICNKDDKENIDDTYSCTEGHFTVHKKCVTNDMKGKFFRCYMCPMIISQEIIKNR